MIYQTICLIAALVCFIVAAVKPDGRWGWAGMAILVGYVLLTKGKII